MIVRFVFALLLAALAAGPALSRAADTQWEVIRVYKLVDGRAVALGVPAEWQEVGTPARLKAHSRLLFLDESGEKIEVPVARLLRASAHKPMLWAEDTKKLALRPRKSS